MTTVYEVTVKWLYANPEVGQRAGDVQSYVSTDEADIELWIGDKERQLRGYLASYALNNNRNRDGQVTGVEFVRKTITITEG